MHKNEFGRLTDWHAQFRNVASIADFEFDLYADTKIYVDEKVFCERSPFWTPNRGDWQYDADGMSANPTLSLRETVSGAISISSPFQLFETEKTFAREDIKRVLLAFKTRLLRAALDDLGLDANWIFAR